MRYSDYRNVTGSLSGDAVEAFIRVYGESDHREQILDAPLATLYSLGVASRRANFPKWAEGCRHRVISGELEKSLGQAIELAKGMV